MSFQNSGLTPDGRRFHRGEPIIVLHLGHQLTGHIAEISESDGEIYVTANLMTGVLNSMSSIASPVDPATGKQTSLPGKFPPIEYVGTGFRHQSTRLVRGEQASSKGMRLFCFADETPNFAMGDAPGTPAINQPPPTQDVSGDVPEGQSSNQEFDPADKNKDGVVTRQEKRQHEKGK